MRVKTKLVIVGTSLVALAAAVAPAMASVNVQLTTTSGTRTLNLYKSDGTTPLTSTDLSSGASNFIAQVVDSSYSNNGFKVQATMSNLYGFANSAYNCNSVVPSSAITLSSPTGLLSVAGVNANLTPVFTLVGTLTPLNVLGLTSSVPINLPVNGLLPSTPPNVQNPLSQSQLTGSGVTNLIGSTLSTLESRLPVSLGTAGLGGNFPNPDVHPTCDATATNASQVPIMTSTADPTGVLGDLQSLIQSTVGSVAPTVSQLISSGYLTSSDVSTALQGVSGLVSQLGLGGLTSQLTNIEGLLTATVSTVTTLPGSLLQSGNYTSSPSLAVNTSGIPAGTYKGVMTVTLVDQ